MVIHKLLPKGFTIIDLEWHNLNRVVTGNYSEDEGKIGAITMPVVIKDIPPG